MSELVCAFGLPWDLHLNGAGCLFCQAEAERLQDAFQAAVRRGEWDEQGYTPSERRSLNLGAGVQQNRFTRPRKLTENGDV